MENKRARSSELENEDLLYYARQMWNRSPSNVLSDKREDRLFRGFFGIAVKVATILWRALDETGCLPDEIKIVHMLWGLMLLKTYSTENVLCAIAGVDAKTFRKWAWAFVNSVSVLEETVVSKFDCCVCLTMIKY